MDLPFALTIAVGLTLIAILLLLLSLIARRKGEMILNYRTLLTVGIIWTGVGIALGESTGSPAFSLLGRALMAIGLAHRDEWELSHLVRALRRCEAIAADHQVTLGAAGCRSSGAIRRGGVELANRRYPASRSFLRRIHTALHPASPVLCYVNSA
jgi:hypothetical protein